MDYMAGIVQSYGEQGYDMVPQAVKVLDGARRAGISVSWEVAGSVEKHPCRRR